MKRAKLYALGIVLLSGLFSVATAEESSNECARTPVEKVEKPNVIWQPGPNGKQVPLWPDEVDIQAPELNGNAEMVGSGSALIAGRPWHWATYVARPTITVYSPRGENTGAAMLVLPGGGYAAVAMDLEGTEVCDWITNYGVTCIILKYRVPQKWSRNKRGV